MTDRVKEFLIGLATVIGATGFMWFTLYAHSGQWLLSTILTVAIVSGIVAKCLYDHRQYWRDK